MTISKEPVALHYAPSYRRNIFAPAITGVLTLLFLTGIILVTFGFPMQAFKSMRIEDVGILLVTVQCGLFVYGRKRHKKGYNAGYWDGFIQRQNYSK